MSSFLGIRAEEDHFRGFTDAGDIPGKFADAEAAKWGEWITPEVAECINNTEKRLIDMIDIRSAIRSRLGNEASRIEVQIGKSYKTRQGDTVTIIDNTPENPTMGNHYLTHPFLGDNKFSYRVDGSWNWLDNEPSSLDLVEEISAV